MLQGRLKICTITTRHIYWIGAAITLLACLLACIGCADSLLVDQDPLISTLSSTNEEKPTTTWWVCKAEDTCTYYSARVYPDNMVLHAFYSSRVVAG